MNRITIPKQKKLMFKKPSLYIESDSAKFTSPLTEGTDINFDITIPAKLENASDSITIPITNPRKLFGASNVACDWTRGITQSSPKLIK